MEFKHQVVEEFLGGEGAAQLCRKYNICSSLLYHWKDMYSRGRFNNEPSEVGCFKGQDRKAGTAGGQADIRERGFKKGLSEQPQPVCQKRQIIRVWGCLGVAVRWGCKVMTLAVS